MNDITRELFNCLEADIPENFEKLKTLFTLSDIAQKAKLAQLTIDIKAFKDNLNILTYAARYQNLTALKFLLEVRPEVSQAIDINAGHPTPMFAAVYYGTDSQKIEEMMFYLMDRKAAITCKCSGFLAIKGENFDNLNLLHILAVKGKGVLKLFKLMLLYGLDYKEKNSHQSNRSYNIYTPYELASSKKSDMSEAIKMMECLDYIKAAIEAFQQKNMLAIIRNISLAYEKDPIYLVDYIAFEIKNINLGKANRTIEDYSFLIKFIDIIAFMTNSSFNQELAVYTHFQDNVLPELAGYDAKSGVIKLFSNNNEKYQFILKFSANTSWHSTAQLLSNSSSIFSTAESKPFDAGRISTTVTDVQGLSTAQLK